MYSTYDKHEQDKVNCFVDVHNNEDNFDWVLYNWVLNEKKEKNWIIKITRKQNFEFTSMCKIF